MSSLLGVTGFRTGFSPAASIPRIDPNYAQSTINTIATEQSKKKGFWDFLGNAVGGVLDAVGKGGTMLDLSNIVKLPSVNVDAGVKTMNWIKIIAIGAGIFLLISLFRRKK